MDSVADIQFKKLLKSQPPNYSMLFFSQLVYFGYENYEQLNTENKRKIVEVVETHRKKLSTPQDPITRDNIYPNFYRKVESK